MSKAQLLDPIGVMCKLILLQFTEVDTKLRIYDHVIYLTPVDVKENYVFRIWYKDSKEDMAILLAPIVRFIELYLLQLHKNKSEDSSDSKKLSDISDDNMDDNLTYTTSKNEVVDNKTSTEETNNKEYLIKLAKYTTTGIPHLMKLYDLLCAGLTLQLYINLINAGISGTYSKELLPVSARNISDNNLLHPDKLKNIWKYDDIKRITELFDNCFSTTENAIMRNGYITNIETILRAKDEEFRKIVNTAY